MLLIRRFLQTSGARSNKFVDKCPPPRYDTGCTYCGLPSFPADKPIDFERNLACTMADHWKHLLILSAGQTHSEWPTKIELQPGSLATELTQYKRSLGSPNHPVMISNVDIPGSKEAEAEDEPGVHRVLLYPEGKVIRFRHSETADFFKTYLRPKDEPIELPYNPFRAMVAETPAEKQREENATAATSFQEQAFNKELVLICGHAQRDVRCGLLAPVLKQEFETVLQGKGLQDKVDVGYISHVGGHAYAGNVLYFGNDKFSSSVWYGRVFPERVQGIVEETILNGAIIKELYRGTSH